MKKQRKGKQTTFSSSGTVYRLESHGTGIWGNRRVPMTIRVDEGIKKAFKPVAQAEFGSTCRAHESLMAAVITAHQAKGLGKVYPTTTVRIENMNILRNVRTRRRLTVEEETEVTSTVSCVYCDKVATYQVFLDQDEKFVCDVHLEAVKASHGLRGYRPLQARRV